MPKGERAHPQKTRRATTDRSDGVCAKDRKLLLNTSDKVAEGSEDLMSSTVRLMDISEANA